MIRYFAAHRTAANLLLLGILALGISALPEMKRETFPDIAPDQVQITIAYPAASPDEVEDAICTRIEDAVENVDFLEEIRCEAREGAAVATAVMEEGHDIAAFADDVKTEIDAIQNLPALAERPVIETLGLHEFVAGVAVTGPDDPVVLRDYAEDLKDRLTRLGLVSRVTISGFSDRQLRVSLSMDALRRHGLTVAEVAERVRAQNTRLPAGFLDTQGAELMLRVEDERRDPAPLGELVIIGGESGGEVRLREIATIDDRFEDEDERVTFDGRRAAILEVSKTKADDTLEVMAALDAFLAEERARAPAGVDLTVTSDMASIVRDRLDMLVGNGVQGLILVFLTMWLFFSFRYSFWVAAGLPVSFMGAFFLMNAIGYSIDMITMVGLLIAIGLLMDDAIVIAENVHAHRERGATRFEAAVQGVKQVGPGILSSFLTTACIFGALAFMEGRMGQILRVMPVVLLMVLATSLVEAFLILPHHLAHGRGGDDVRRIGRFRAWFDSRFEDVRQNRFGPLVDRALRWRYLTVGLVLATVVLAVSLPASGLLKFQAFPDLEGDVAQAKILMPAGTPFARQEEVVARVAAAARAVNAAYAPAQPDGRDLIQHMSVDYGSGASAFMAGSKVVVVTLDLLSAEIRQGAAFDDVLAAWREAVGQPPDVTQIVYTERQIGPAGQDIDIRIHGRDLDQLKAAAVDLTGWLAGYAGVHDLNDDLQPGKPELQITLKDGAMALGFTAADIADQLRAAYQGVVVQEFHERGQTVEIDVRLTERDRDSLGDLDDFVVSPAAGGGAAVPLHMVADVAEGRGWNRILRVDGQRTVTVQGRIDSTVANAAEVIADTRAKFLPELTARYPELAISLEGQAKETAETGASVRGNLLLGLVGVYLLLAFQFRSYLEPVVVMAAIPLALVGAILGHVLIGFDLSMPSVVGLASLAGVVVNDTILLVLFMKEHVARGESPETAAALAARGRFRAILLTSLTTVMGLIPLLLEQSLQAQIIQPLVTSIAFGLTGATFLSLFLVPCLYVILADLGLVGKPAPAAAPSLAE